MRKSPEQSPEFAAPEATEFERWWHTSETAREGRRNLEHAIWRDLQEGIRNDRWSSLIIDDTSARLPGLVIARILSRYSKEHHRPPVHVHFVWGSPLKKKVYAGENPPHQELVQHFSNLNDRNLLGNRALVLTEFTWTRTTIKSLSQALKEIGLRYDIEEIPGGDPTWGMRPEAEKAKGVLAWNTKEFQKRGLEVEGLHAPTPERTPEITREVQSARKLLRSYADEVYEKFFTDQASTSV